MLLTKQDRVIILRAALQFHRVWFAYRRDWIVGGRFLLLLLLISSYLLTPDFLPQSKFVIGNMQITFGLSVAALLVSAALQLRSASRNYKRWITEIRQSRYTIPEVELLLDLAEAMQERREAVHDLAAQAADHPRLAQLSLIRALQRFPYGYFSGTMCHS